MEGSSSGSSSAATAVVTARALVWCCVTGLCCAIAGAASINAVHPIAVPSSRTRRLVRPFAASLAIGLENKVTRMSFFETVHINRSGERPWEAPFVTSQADPVSTGLPANVVGERRQSDPYWRLRSTLPARNRSGFDIEQCHEVLPSAAMLTVLQ